MSDLFCEGASAVLEGSSVEIGKEELAQPVKANGARTTNTASSPYVSLRFSQKFLQIQRNHHAISRKYVIFIINDVFSL